MRYFLIIFAFLAGSVTVNSQTPGQINRITLYIKLWGFLKYNHSGVAQGTINWDSVFLHQVCKVKDSKTKNDFNVILRSMLDAAGNYSTRLASDPAGDLELRNKPGIEWAAGSKLLDQSTKDQINQIFMHRHQGPNRFIKHNFETLDFSIENDFKEIEKPGAEFRLLFLARYWNIIDYLAPYKYLIPDWDKVLPQFALAAIKASDKNNYYKTLVALARATKDGHSQINLPSGDIEEVLMGKFRPPFYCSIVDKKVFVRFIPENKKKENDILPGDEIVEMDGKPLTTIIAESRQFISASNLSGEMHQLSRKILHGKSADATLKIRRQGTTKTVKIQRSDSETPDWVVTFNYSGTSKGYEVLPDSILLVYAAFIWDANIDTIQKLALKSRAVIFDVRNYPQNDAIYSVVSPFLSEPRYIDYATALSGTDPGVFEWKLNPNKVGHHNPRPFQGKVIILCDERTQSQGEYACMVLQTIPGAKTFGRQTAGADGKQTLVPMGGGITIGFSAQGIYYPDKTATQQKGIRVDKHIKQTPKGIEKGIDEILEAAISSLK